MPSEAHRDVIARRLAAALLAVPWSARGLAEACERLLGPETLEAQRRLVEALVMAWQAPYPPPPRWIVDRLLSLDAWIEQAPELVEFPAPQDGGDSDVADADPTSDEENDCIDSVPVYRHLWPAGRFTDAVAPVLEGRLQLPMPLDAPLFAPAAPLARLAIPRLSTSGDLACWLGIDAATLDWLADERRQAARTRIPVLQNYHYSFIPKRRGPPRLIEAPKARLKAIQRRILAGILAPVPVHDAARGFVAGRSCIDAAQLHAGEEVVVTLDIADFFLTVPVARIHAIWRTLGYPWAVARALTGLVTTATPRGVFRRLPPASRHDWRTQQLYSTPHLPQGAPTSPALANLACFRLDVRLSALARRIGANYSRYADDLAFSGHGSARCGPRRLTGLVARIVRDEGLVINPAKTRVMPRSGRQRVTGLVVNEHVNVPRDAYDRLKAILHNCRRHGSASQNLDGLPDWRAHLDGRVQWVEQVNRRRGARLRAIYEAIDWSTGRP